MKYRLKIGDKTFGKRKDRMTSGGPFPRSTYKKTDADFREIAKRDREKRHSPSKGRRPLPR